MRKRNIVTLLIALMVVLVAASAQTTEEAAAIEGLQEALDGLGCVTAEGCTEDLAEVKAALAVMKPLFPDVGYFGLEGAIRWVIQDLDGHQHGPPTGADAVDVVRVKGAALIAEAAAALVADAEAAASGGTTTTAQATSTTSASTTSTSAGEVATGDTPTTTLEAAASRDSSSSGVPAVVWVVGGISLLALLAWLIRMLMLRSRGA